jgi:uncharacterized protein
LAPRGVGEAGIFVVSRMERIEGVGLGLRFALVEELLARESRGEVPAIRWLECHPENYMRRGGRWPDNLRRCRERWPFATHGLAMSLGGVDPLDRDYLATLRRFLGELEVPWHSDHLCFSVAHGAASHDLLPMPWNEDTAAHFAARIREAQDQLPCVLAVENISYYLKPAGSTLDDGTFVDAVVRASGCKLMLDVNNVYVNARNHGEDPRVVLARMPLDQVVQIHVAGHYYEEPDFILDTHAEPLCDDVYELLSWTLERTGRVPILLERDDDFPPFEDLYAEIERLDRILRAAPERPKSAGPDPSDRAR